jgi:exopolyphosphatase/guanosine-5'-triphosphate,3'-diphosphate pyrophosphatase
MRLAGVDIGTLTCRLLIADLPHGGRLKEIRSERRILRLGEGVDQTKQLSVAAMDRVLQCLREWRELIDALVSMLRRLLRRAPFVMQRTVMSFSIA